MKDHEVGYKKPPKHSQFKKGESGNPKGRMKNTRNLKTDLTEELRERIVAREGDRTIKISKQRAVVKSLVAKTIKGDARAASNLLNMFFRTIDPAGEIAEAVAPMTQEEREVLAGFEERFATPAATSDGAETSEPEEEES
jgi:hypothetical protein